MQSRTTLELRNLDPLAEKNEILEGFATATSIEQADIHVRSMRMAPSGTQTAILDAPTYGLPQDITSRTIKIVLTISYARILRKVTRCFRCHALGPLSNTHKSLPLDKEVCRKCAAPDHSIKDCNKEPCCMLCAAQGRGFETSSRGDISGMSSVQEGHPPTEGSEANSPYCKLTLTGAASPKSYCRNKPRSRVQT